MPAVHGAAALKFRSLCRAGNLLRVAQNNVEAADAYSDSLRLKPAQLDVLARLGELLLKSGDAFEALAHCRRALDIDPNHEAARALERRILASTGALDRAEALLEAQSKSPVELAQNLDQLGAFLRAERRHEEAVSIYRKIVLLEPDRADWKFNLALALEGLGQKEEAFASYQAGLAIEPDRAEAYANVGCLLRSTDMQTGAIHLSPRWREVRDETKFAHMLTFGKALPRIRRRVERDIRRRGLPREKILAAVVRLMERTLGRVGNPEYAKQNDSFGMTTLRRDHVRIAGGNIELDFRGKHGVHQHKVVTDPTLARILRRCHELPGSELFRYIDENGTLHRIYLEDVNAYLRDCSGHHITAKDFRTWAATNLAVLEMMPLREAKPSKRAVAGVVKRVAELSATRPRSAARATSIRACSPLISMARSSQRWR
jgi:Flp pilus assembly protein TadD